MAEVNAIQRGELQGRLVRGLGIIGERSPAPVLATEVVPVVLLEDLRGFGDEVVARPAAGTITRTPAAGFFSNVQLFNPAGGTASFDVDEIIITTPLAQFVWLSITATALTIAGAGLRWRDSGLAGAPSGQLWAADTAAMGQVGGTVGGAYILASTPFHYRGKLILTPGNGVSIHSNTVNAEIDVTLFWTERSRRA